MCNLTAPIPVGACRTVRVWAAQRGASTLRVRPQSHQNAPRKASFSSAYPSLTTILPVTYHYQPPASPNPKNSAVFTGETVKAHLTHSISIA
jgi:hypothetical protein